MVNFRDEYYKYKRDKKEFNKNIETEFEKLVLNRMKKKYKYEIYDSGTINFDDDDICDLKWNEDSGFHYYDYDRRDYVTQTLEDVSKEYIIPDPIKYNYPKPGEPVKEGMDIPPTIKPTITYKNGKRMINEE